MAGFDIDSTKIISLIPRCSVNDEISWSFNVNQRMAEVDILCDTTNDLQSEIKRVQEKLVVMNQENKNMHYEVFDVSRII